MIARVWRGWSTLQDSVAYRRHFAESVSPALEVRPGYRGAFLLLREAAGDSRTEFLVLTLWDSMDAVRAFAGPDPERAVVDEAARAALVAFEETVRHYAVVSEPGSPAGGAPRPRRSPREPPGSGENE